MGKGSNLYSIDAGEITEEDAQKMWEEYLTQEGITDFSFELRRKLAGINSVIIGYGQFTYKRGFMDGGQ
jgi:hypothetical protein